MKKSNDTDMWIAEMRASLGSSNCLHWSRVFQEDQKMVKKSVESQVNYCLAHLDTSTVLLTQTATSTHQSIQRPSYTTIIKSVYVRVSKYLQSNVKDQCLPAYLELTHI